MRLTSWFFPELGMSEELFVLTHAGFDRGYRYPHPRRLALKHPILGHEP